MEPASDTDRSLKLAEIRHRTLRLGINWAGALIGFALVSWVVVRVAENPNSDPPWVKVALAVISVPWLAWVGSKIKEATTAKLIKGIYKWVDKLPSKAEKLKSIESAEPQKSDEVKNDR